MGIIKKSGSWFSYNESKLGQGSEAVKGIIKDNPELLDEITAKVTERLAEKKD
jgi:recombination protein RecA